MAAEVADALGSVRLSRAEQEQIYARSLALLEEALHEQRRGWQRVLRVERRAPVLVGGAAALTLGAAAIGWPAGGTWTQPSARPNEIRSGPWISSSGPSSR